MIAAVNKHMVLGIVLIVVGAIAIVATPILMRRMRSQHMRSGSSSAGLLGVAGVIIVIVGVLLTTRTI
jgi:threonine/homoserine/homoserine lactone efflux protein